MEFFEASEEDEWGTPAQHMVAGSVAGVVEHCSILPIDALKTHVQAYGNSHSLAGNARHIFGQLGVRGFFRGLSAMAAGAGPAHAVFFASYELAKAQLGANMAGHRPVATAASGIFATVAMDSIMTPADALKQRMQLGSYSSMYHAVTAVRAAGGGGFGSLYAGFTTTLTLNLPYNMLFFASYESYKLFLAPYFDVETTPNHLLSGGMGGLTAAAFTTPLDVAKTRLQTQFETGKRYGGMVDAVRTIWREEGVSGLTRGLVPRVAFHSLSGAICWATYEAVKAFLLKKRVLD